MKNKQSEIEGIQGFKEHNGYICIYCKYKQRPTTNAFTNFTCEECKRNLSWHNGSPPRICYACSEITHECLYERNKVWTVEEKIDLALEKQRESINRALLERSCTRLMEANQLISETIKDELEALNKDYLTP